MREVAYGEAREVAYGEASEVAVGETRGLMWEKGLLRREL